MFYYGAHALNIFLLMHYYDAYIMILNHQYSLLEANVRQYFFWKISLYFI